MDSEVYCDSQCFEITSFLELDILYNNKWTCEEECVYPNAHYVSQTENYCGSSCTTLQNEWGFGSLFNVEGTCQDDCTELKVSYSYNVENYCDDTCNAMETYLNPSLNLGTLFNYENVC